MPGLGEANQGRGIGMPVDLNMPILLVDDQLTMLQLEQNLLDKIGFRNIDSAQDGRTALQKARANKFGLIISDWSMEPMSGLELLKEVRADPELKNIPFIMLTAEGNPENVAMAKRAGVDNYIVKPCNAALLKKKIAAVIGDF